MIFGSSYSRGSFFNLQRKLSVRSVSKMVCLKQTKETVGSSDVLASSVMVYYACGRCLKANTSSYSLFRLRKLFDYMYSNKNCIVDLWWFSIKLSDIGKWLRFGAGCSSGWNWCVLSSVCSCVFYRSVSVGSSATQWMSAFFHLGRMKNALNP